MRPSAEAIVVAAQCASVLVSDLRQAHAKQPTIAGDIVLSKLLQSAVEILDTLNRLSNEVSGKEFNDGRHHE